MRIIALVAWSATAIAGLRLFWSWLAAGGIRQQAIKVTRFPAVLVLAHPACALTGLGYWAAYVVTHRLVDAWTAFGVLCGSVLLGFALLTRWLTGQGGRHARGGERRLPTYAVVLHVSGAIATFVLVLITATIASRR